MADAAGIEFRKARDVEFYLSDGDTISLPFDVAIATIRQKMSVADMYERRTMRYDRGVMLALIDAWERAGRLTGVKLDARSAGEAAGMSKDAASKALRRLAHGYGYIRRGDADLWSEDDTYQDDAHAVRMFEAYAWEPSEVCKTCTVLNSSSLEEAEQADARRQALPTTACTTELPQLLTADNYCIASAQIDLAVVQDYITHDAFLWGAKDSDDNGLGKSALEIIAALSDCNDLSFAEIAEAGSLSRSTVSRRVRALEAIGMVELY
jgi:hypothetical protein